MLERYIPASVLGSVLRKSVENQERVHWSQVLQELGEGRLDSLARHIRETEYQIDPDVAKKLAQMIDGRSSETGWRLKVVKHPALPNAKRGREQMMSHSKLQLRIAFFIAETELQIAPGKNRLFGLEDATAAACQKFKLSQTSVKKPWAKFAQIARQRAKAKAALRSDRVQRGCKNGASILPESPLA